MLKLDRNRPYGTVYPGSPACAYEQDGALFDSDGHPAKLEGAGAAPAAQPEPTAPAIPRFDEIESPTPSELSFGARRGRPPKNGG